MDRRHLQKQNHHHHPNNNNNNNNYHNHSNDGNSTEEEEDESKMILVETFQKLVTAATSTEDEEFYDEDDNNDDNNNNNNNTNNNDDGGGFTLLPSIEDRQGKLCLQLIYHLKKQQQEQQQQTKTATTTDDPTTTTTTTTMTSSPKQQQQRTIRDIFSFRMMKSTTTNTHTTQKNLIKLSLLPPILCNLISYRIDTELILPATQDDIANEIASSTTTVANILTLPSLYAAELYSILLRLPGALGSGLIELQTITALTTILRRWTIECCGREYDIVTKLLQQQQQQKRSSSSTTTIRRNRRQRYTTKTSRTSSYQSTISQDTTTTSTPTTSNNRLRRRKTSRQSSSSSSSLTTTMTTTTTSDSPPTKRSRRNRTTRFASSTTSSTSIVIYSSSSDDDDDDDQDEDNNNDNNNSNNELLYYKEQKSMDTLQLGFNVALALCHIPYSNEFSSSWSSEAREAILDGIIVILSTCYALSTTTTTTTMSSSSSSTKTKSSSSSTTTMLRTSLPKTKTIPTPTILTTINEQAIKSLQICLIDTNSNMTQRHETAVVILRGLYPLLVWKEVVPNGERGKQSVHTIAGQTLQLLLETVSKHIESIEEEKKKKKKNRRRNSTTDNTTTTTFNTPRRQQRRRSIDGTTPSSTMKTPKSQRKRRVSIDGVDGLLTPMTATPALKGRRRSFITTTTTTTTTTTNSTTTTNTEYHHQDGSSVNNNQQKQKQQQPRLVLSAFIGLLQKLSTTTGLLERVCYRSPTLDLLLRCITILPKNPEQSYFLNYLITLCRSKLSIHRLVSCELIGLIVIQSWFYDNYCNNNNNNNNSNNNTETTTTNNCSSSPVTTTTTTPTTTESSLSSSSMTLPIALVQAIQGRLIDRVAAVRIRAASAIESLLHNGTTTNNNDNNNNNQQQQKSKNFFLKLLFNNDNSSTSNLLNLICQRAKYDETASVRKAMINTMIQLLIYQPNWITEYEINILCDLTLDSTSIVTRKAAAEGLTKLLIVYQNKQYNDNNKDQHRDDDDDDDTTTNNNNNKENIQQQQQQKQNQKAATIEEQSPVLVVRKEKEGELSNLTYTNNNTTAIRNLLEVAWTTHVLPMTLDDETGCSTKATAAFNRIVISPILHEKENYNNNTNNDYYYDNNSNNTIDFDNEKGKEEMAWHILALVAGRGGGGRETINNNGSGSSSSSSSSVSVIGQRQALQVALKQLAIENPSRMYQSLVQRIVSVAYQTLPSSSSSRYDDDDDEDDNMEDETTNHDDESLQQNQKPKHRSKQEEDQMVGVWCLLDALLSSSSANCRNGNNSSTLASFQKDKEVMMMIDTLQNKKKYRSTSSSSSSSSTALSPPTTDGAFHFVLVAWEKILYQLSSSTTTTTTMDNNNTSLLLGTLKCTLMVLSKVVLVTSTSRRMDKNNNNKHHHHHLDTITSNKSAIIHCFKTLQQFVTEFTIPTNVINAAISTLVAISIATATTTTTTTTYSTNQRRRIIQQECSKWIQPLYQSCEDVIANFVQNKFHTNSTNTNALRNDDNDDNSISESQTSERQQQQQQSDEIHIKQQQQRHLRVVRALFTVGELSMIGFRPDNDNHSNNNGQDKNMSSDIESISTNVSAEQGTNNRMDEVEEEEHGALFDFYLRHFHERPSKRLEELVLTMLSTYLPSNNSQQTHTSTTNTSLTTALATPDSIRAHAFTAIGKLCLREERLAKNCLNVLARELHPTTSLSKFQRQRRLQQEQVGGGGGPDGILTTVQITTSPAVKSNALLILGDLCVRYTNMVDRYLPVMACCLQAGCQYYGGITSSFSERDEHDEDTNLLLLQNSNTKNTPKTSEKTSSGSNISGSSEMSIVRKHAILMLSSLLLQDYIKWRGLLFHRFLVATCDEEEDVATLAEKVLCGPLLVRHPKLFYNNFVESIFVLNQCKSHAMYLSAIVQEGGAINDDGNNNTGNNSTTTSATIVNNKNNGSGEVGVGFAGIHFRGYVGEIKRRKLYEFLLSNMSDEEKIGITARLTKEVLGCAVNDCDGDLGRVCRRSQQRNLLASSTGRKTKKNEKNDSINLENAWNVLSDTFYILKSKSIKIGKHTLTTNDDCDDDIAVEDPNIVPNPSRQVSVAKRKLLSNISRKQLIEIVLPIACHLKLILQTSCSPLLKDLMSFVLDLFRIYKVEVKEFLANDPILLQELEYDARQQQQQQKGNNVDNNGTNSNSAEDAPVGPPVISTPQ